MLSGRPVPIGQWTHVAVVCDTGDFRIYLNGSPESGVQWMETARNQGVTQPGSDGTILCVGGPGPDALTGFFDGLVDELRFSTVARTFEPDPAVLIGNRKELFLDDDLIADMKCVRRVVNQPERYEGNPLLEPKGEWEGRSLQELGLIYDHQMGLFRTWYRDQPDPVFRTAPVRERGCLGRRDPGGIV